MTLSLSLRLSIAIAAIGACPLAAAATLRVGADSSCDFHRVSDAIAASRHSDTPVVIRLARNVRHELHTTAGIGRQVSFAGGYSNCSDLSALGATTLIVHSDVMQQAIAAWPGSRGVRVRAAAHAQSVVDLGKR